MPMSDEYAAERVVLGQKFTASRRPTRPPRERSSATAATGGPGPTRASSSTTNASRGGSPRQPEHVTVHDPDVEARACSRRNARRPRGSIRSGFAKKRLRLTKGTPALTTLCHVEVSGFLVGSWSRTDTRPPVDGLPGRGRATAARAQGWWPACSWLGGSAPQYDVKRAERAAEVPNARNQLWI